MKTYLELLHKLRGVWPGQREFPDGPGQPMSHVVLGPHPRVPGDAQPGAVGVPRGVGGLEDLVHLLVGAGGQGGDLGRDTIIISIRLKQFS